MPQVAARHRRGAQRARLLLPLLTLAVPLVASPPVQAAHDPQISLSAGYVGAASRAGDWVPVTVTITGGDSDFTGELVLTTGQIGSAGGGFISGPGCVTQVFPGGMSTSCSGSGAAVFGGSGSSSGTLVRTTGDTGTGAAITYRIPVAVSAGVAKHYSLTVQAAEALLHAELHSAAGTRAATGDTSVPISSGRNPLVGVVSDSETALDSAGTIRLSSSGGPLQLVHLAPSGLPVTGVALRNFAALIIDGATTTALGSDQRQALADFVADGGGLIVAAGAGARGTLSGIPGALLPASVGGSAQSRRLASLGDLSGAAVPATPVDLSTLTAGHGAVTLRDGATVLVVEGAHGRGRIVMTAFDPAIEPLASWAGASSLVRSLVLRATQPQQAAVADAGACFKCPNNGALGDQGARLASALQDVPAFDIPSAAAFGSLVVLYIAVAGPLNYLVLQRVRRRDLMWLTVPLVSVVFAGATYATGLGTRTSGAVVSQVRVVSLTGDSRALVDTFAVVDTPRGGSYAVPQPHSALVAGLVGIGDSGGGLLSAVPGSDPVVSLQNAGDASVHGYRTSVYRDVTGSLSTHLHLDANGHLVGTVTNHLGTELAALHALGGGQTQDLGRLADGATASVDILAQGGTVGFNGGPPFGCCGPQSVNLNRDERRRQEVLAGLGDTAGPELVGVATGNVLPVENSGNGVSIDSIDAVIMPLAASADSGVALTGRVVEITPGKTTTAGLESELGPGGAVTFEYALDAHNAHGLRIDAHQSLQNPSNGSFGPSIGTGPGGGPNVGITPSASPTAALQVFNVRTRAWDEQPGLGPGLAIPRSIAGSADYVSSDGLVLIRVRNSGQTGLFVIPPAVATDAAAASA